MNVLLNNQTTKVDYGQYSKSASRPKHSFQGICLCCSQWLLQQSHHNSTTTISTLN